MGGGEIVGYVLLQFFMYYVQFCTETQPQRLVAGLDVTGDVLHSAAKTMPELQALCASWRKVAFRHY